jgi:magnesium transporter
MTRQTADLTADTPSVDPEDLEDLALEDDYTLNPEYVDMVIDAADRNDGARIKELMEALHPADVADLMGFLTADYREELIPHIAPDDLAEILSELDTNLRKEILESAPAASLAKALEELDTDDAVDVVDDLDGAKRAAVLAAMPEIERAAIERSLAYEDETAGRLMQREVLAAPQFWTVGDAIDHIRADPEALPELFFDLYVVDPAYKPIGALPISQLLRASRDTPLTSLMEPVTEITADMDQEEVAYIFDKYHLISAPVVEPGGRLVGQITVDDIVGVIQEEAQEDILALAGVSDAGRDASVAGIVRARLPWLCLNLVTATIAVTSIAMFQGEISKVVALAVLMPIVASLGGNAGNQTLAVAVRALAGKELTESNALRTVLREMGVGITHGLVLASLLGTATLMVFHNIKLALVVGLALMTNIFIAAVAGILAPLALERIGRDPAVSSSIFVTFLTDFSGFLAVLILAALILN